MEEHAQLTGLPGAEAVASMSIDELKRLVEMVSEQGVTRKSIAEEAGYSGSALSSWMKGTYTKGGDDRGFELALRGALERILVRSFMAGNRSTQRFRRVSTTVTDTVFSIARACQKKGWMGILTGAPGRGKTTSAEMYRAMTDNVLYVRTSKFMTPRKLMTAIADQVNVVEKSTYDMQVRVCEELQKTKGLVIIDEAENLSLDILDSLRQLNDWSGAGLLFIGQDVFYTMIARARKSHEYLADRFKTRDRVKDIQLADVERLLSTEIPNHRNIAPALLQACEGSTRVLETLIFNLLPLLERGDELDEKMISEAAAQIRVF